MGVRMNKKFHDLVDRIPPYEMFSLLCNNYPICDGCPLHVDGGRECYNRFCDEYVTSEDEDGGFKRWCDSYKECDGCPFLGRDDEIPCEVLYEREIEGNGR